MYERMCYVKIDTLQFIKKTQGCAHFPNILQDFSEHQILWSLCSVVFCALPLKLPIQTSLSVVPKLTVSLSSHEKHPNFRKTSTPQRNYRVINYTAKRFNF